MLPRVIELNDASDQMALLTSKCLCTRMNSTGKCTRAPGARTRIFFQNGGPSRTQTHTAPAFLDTSRSPRLSGPRLPHHSAVAHQDLGSRRLQSKCAAVDHGSERRNNVLPETRAYLYSSLWSSLQGEFSSTGLPWKPRLPITEALHDTGYRYCVNVTLASGANMQGLQWYLPKRKQRCLQARRLAQAFTRQKHDEARIRITWCPWPWFAAAQGYILAASSQVLHLHLGLLKVHKAFTHVTKLGSPPTTLRMSPGLALRAADMVC